MIVFKLLKWIFGVASGALSVLLLLYLGMKNEYWAIVTDDGKVIVDKTMGICLIAVWGVIGALFLLFEYLYKRSIKKKAAKKEHYRVFVIHNRYKFLRRFSRTYFYYITFCVLSIGAFRGNEATVCVSRLVRFSFGL